MRKIPILFSFLFLHCFSGQAQKAQDLEELFSSLYQEGRFNGNVLIAENGEIIFQKSYGFANHATGQKLNDSTVFDLASVSKEFTATAIHLLYKRGKIKYEDPIGKYIPELNFYKEVKIKHLIHHTSGLPDFMQLLPKYWNPMLKARNIDFVNLFEEYQPDLVFQPGEKFEYSNTGYALLGLIIERVSGKSYGNFLKENIFKPLKMNHTQVYRHFYDQWEIPNYAIGYISDSLQGKIAVDDLKQGNFRHYLDGIIGAGQIKSTTIDLLKWDRALYGNELFDEKDKELFFKPVQLNNGKKVAYGFGWVIKEENSYGKITYHPGRWGGYINHFERDLDHDKTIIILQNHDLEKTITPKNRVRDILYDQKAYLLKAKQLEQFAGIYKSETGSFELKYENGNLFYVVKSGNEFRMKALSDRKLMASQYLFDVYFDFKKISKKKTEVVFEYPALNIQETYLKIN